MAMTYLYLDVGNTAVKYLYKDSYGYFIDCAEFSSFLSSNKVDGIYLSSVSDNSDAFITLALGLGYEVKPIVVTNHFDGLSLRYADVSTFGVDRWLSILAARELFPAENLCIVSVGTALTVDCVTANGQHLGGAIAPGLVMGVAALHAKTGKLPRSDLSFSGCLGSDTNSSINYGVVMGAVGLIECSIKSIDVDTTLILSGGDAELLSPWLLRPSNLVPNMVLKGLHLYSTINN